MKNSLSLLALAIRRRFFSGVSFSNGDTDSAIQERMFSAHLSNPYSESLGRLRIQGLLKRRHHGFEVSGKTFKGFRVIVP